MTTPFRDVSGLTVAFDNAIAFDGAITFSDATVGEFSPPCQLNMDILKRVAMYNVGKKMTVVTASVFIAELSLAAETAIRAAKRLSS